MTSTVTDLPETQRVSIPVSIAVDAMSGDSGYTAAVDAALHALKRNPALSITLVGDEAVLSGRLDDIAPAAELRQRLSLRAASEVVSMDEAPAQALRRKKDSSMRVAIDMVAAGEADACVSAGNTGALMATAKFVLKTLPGVDRPAIVTAMPTISGATHVLDLGANAECTSEQLLQFAAMGSALVTALYGVKQPRVALLNIGQEAIKGNTVVKRAAALIKASPLNFVGSIEGDSLFLDPVDVVVCDGFVGNIGLKVGEGVAQLVGRFMREEFMRSWRTKIVGIVARGVLHRLAERIDPRRYNGATMIGLRGIVVKSHGGADTMAFANAIEVAMRQVRQTVPQLIEERVNHSLQTVNGAVEPRAEKLPV